MDEQTVYLHTVTERVRVNRWYAYLRSWFTSPVINDKHVLTMFKSAYGSDTFISDASHEHILSDMAGVLEDKGENADIIMLSPISHKPRKKIKDPCMLVNCVWFRDVGGAMTVIVTMERMTFIRAEGMASKECEWRLTNYEREKTFRVHESRGESGKRVMTLSYF